MNIETVAIEKLVPDPSNARKHDKKNIEAIKGSLAKFGQQKPIVINKDNVVIAGNGTLESAKALGWKDIKVIRTELDRLGQTAYAIADNRTGELAEWDKDVLGRELLALKDEGMDLSDIGFDVSELDEFLPEESKTGLTEDDDVPEVDKNKFGVKLGQIWQLGEHRLMCGDSTVKENVDKLMNGEKADMVFTDPPYGINHKTNFHTHKNTKIHSKGQTSREFDLIKNDDRAYDASHIFISFGCDEIFLWGADYYFDTISDFRDGSIIVWDKRTKNDGTFIENAWGSEFELCWSKSKHKREIARIIHCGLLSIENDKRVHPTQKPVALAEWFFQRWGKDKNLIVDLFLGSGSTLIACEKTNRKCYGMEIDPHYCSVIIERWQNSTSKEAKLWHDQE